MKKDDIITLILIGGGAYALYWYLTNYDGTGSVFAANGTKLRPSYWDQWFGGATAVPPPATGTGTTAPGTTTTTTPPVSTLPPMPTPTPGPAPYIPPANQSGIIIPTGFAVANDINNSLKGTVSINGVHTTLNIIPGNAASGTGIVWNTSGNDVTSSFTPAEVQQLILAYTTAPVVAMSALSGLYGPMPPSFSRGKGFGRDFGEGKFRRGYGPMVN